MEIATRNPATQELLASFVPLDASGVDQRLQRSSEAFGSFRLSSFKQRAHWLERAAEIMIDEVEDLARIITIEMGKPIESARAEILKCVSGARYYATHAADFLAPEPVAAEIVGASQAYVRWEPIGAVLAVMPWNYPFWQVMRFAAPALMAGNTGLLKHASNVPQTALAIESVFLRAGFPEGVFQSLLISTEQVADVIADSRVAAVTLTGSEGAGRAVGAAAGRAIKKTVLELGGNDAFIVLPSADVAHAAAVGAKSRCQNSGQSCIAAKRFIIHRQVADVFLESFVNAMEGIVVGDPTLDSTQMGPLATQQGLSDVDAIVSDAVAKGARVLLGGRPVLGPGWFYPPTIVTGIDARMRISHEEVFGPVAQLFIVESIDEAIALANDTRLGLSASAWTTDALEQDILVSGLASGAVFINGMSASYPELPFGGIKDSGYGRELGSMGIREFCNAKTVWIRT